MQHRDRTEVALFGRDPARAVRLSVVAAVLFFVGALVHVWVQVLGPVPPTAEPVVTAVFAAMFLVALAGGYLNDGLLVCVALAAGVGLGFYLPAIVFQWGRAGRMTVEALAVGTASGVGLGAVGFLVGGAARRLVGRVRAAWLG